MNTSFKNKNFIIIASISFFLINVLPLIFGDTVIRGHDILFHLNRIQALSIQLEHGILYSKINYPFLYGQGYAASMAYPDLFLYLPAIFCLFGINIIISYKIFLFILTCISFFNSYISIRYFTKNNISAFFGAFLYIISIYHFDLMLCRAAVGEYIAFSFFPLIVMASHNAIFGDVKNNFILTISFSAIVLSHIIYSVISIFYFIIFIAINIRYLTVKKLKSITYYIAIAMGITSFFWIPLLEFYIKNDLNVKYASNLLANMAVSPISFIIPVCLLNDKASFPIILYIIAFFYFKKSTTNKIADKYFIIACIILICTTKIFPWEKLNILSFIQFPWRLYTIVTFFISISLAIYSISFFRKKTCSIQSYLICGLTLFTVVYYPLVHFDRGILSSSIYMNHQKGLSDIGGGKEFLPHTESVSPKIYFSSEYWKERGQKDFDSICFRTKNSYITNIIADFTHYHGYVAHSNDGEKFFPVRKDNKSGLCNIEVNDFVYDDIVIAYHQTPLQTISYTVTSLTLLFVIYIIIKNIWIRKREPESSIYYSPS